MFPMDHMNGSLGTFNQRLSPMPSGPDSRRAHAVPRHAAISPPTSQLECDARVVRPSARPRSPVSTPITIGLLQFAPQVRSAHENVQFVVSRIRRLQDATIVLPECFLGSYGDYPLFFHEESELGRILEPLLRVSVDRRLALVGSLPVHSSAGSFNRALLLHQGIIYTIYDKVRLYGDEHGHFEQGDTAHNVVHIPDFDLTCTVQICLDISDPLPLQSPALRSVQLVLGPSTVSVDFLRTFHKVRALETQTISIFCNRTGSDLGGAITYLGRSAIFFPDGSECCLSAEDEALKLITLDRQQLRDMTEARKSFFPISS
jgi:predicted amidohydrolase